MYFQITNFIIRVNQIKVINLPSCLLTTNNESSNSFITLKKCA